FPTCPLTPWRAPSALRAWTAGPPAPYAHNWKRFTPCWANITRRPLAAACPTPASTDHEAHGPARTATHIESLVAGGRAADSGRLGTGCPLPGAPADGDAN